MRVSVSTVVGVVAGVLVGLLLDWIYAAAVAFDLAALIFLVWTWAAVGRMDAEQTALHATREDPTRRTTRLIVLAACVASLGGVGVLLVHAAREQGAQRAGVAALGLGSVAVSWFVVHGLFICTTPSSTTAAVATRSSRARAGPAASTSAWTPRPGTATSRTWRSPSA